MIPVDIPVGTPAHFMGPEAPCPHCRFVHYPSILCEPKRRYQDLCGLLTMEQMRACRPRYAIT